jgi:transcriptional regulator with XRE-family HTH domain
MTTNSIMHKILIQSNLTQREFAERADISFPRLNQMINGKSEVKYSTLERISKNLGLTIKIEIS